MCARVCVCVCVGGGVCVCVREGVCVCGCAGEWWWGEEEVSVVGVVEEE